MTKSPCLMASALLLTILSVACTGQKPAAGTDALDADEKTAHAGPATPDDRDIPVIQEAFLTPMTPEDNIDSPASWTAPDGQTWLLATAKATDKLMIYDGQTGQPLRSFGATGKGQGQFERPNGIAVIDGLAFVVERDNHRVQVLGLPDFEHVLTFGAEQLRKPYGLWVNRVEGGYEVYVTDAYMAGEDAQGEDILPALQELDKRVWRYQVSRGGDRLTARALGSFGDATPEGALRVVESIWGDPANDRLLIAEEDETYANELKVYDLAGKFSGRTIGRDVFKAQSEGIMLKTCGDGGWWLTTEQGKGRTVFHLFDRVTLEHAGAVAGARVANTDGIWLDAAASARFPQGALYAVHDDQGVVAFDWRDISDALSLPECGAQ